MCYERKYVYGGKGDYRALPVEEDDAPNFVIMCKRNSQLMQLWIFMEGTLEKGISMQ